MSDTTPWLADYGLIEHTHAGYPARTTRNVIDADLTFVFGREDSPGCRLTVDIARSDNKPYRCIRMEPWPTMCTYAEAVDQVVTKLREVDPAIVNIAGNREHSNPGLRDAVYRLLVDAITEYRR